MYLFTTYRTDTGGYSQRRIVFEQLEGGVSSLAPDVVTHSYRHTFDASARYSVRGYSCGELE